MSITDCRILTPAAMGLDSGCAPCDAVLDAIAETFGATIDWLDELSRRAGSSAGSPADWGGVLAAHLRASATEEQRVFRIRFLHENWEYVHPACLLVFHGYVSGLAEHLVASCPDVAPRATAAFLRRCARRADDYLLASFQATVLRVQQVLEVGRFAAGASGRAADAEAAMLRRFWLELPAASAPLALPDGAEVGADVAADVDFSEPFVSDADTDEDGWRSDETGASDAM